ncbi:MAG TPA: 5'/3'-nucleotidase SurE [Prevotellaceae bacterium]|jgi:5'-nucleotidase|nr:5'/3'-nucleotidase SurE [Prevotellaceae bacterium]
MKPLILISNDDGYLAKGINALIEMLRPIGDLLVVAPDHQRSAAGCSITTEVPITSKIVRQEEGLTVYSCTGTPADCIKLALNQHASRKPNLVVSGINHGTNATINEHYSGTVSIAKEGTMHGIPSIAFSLCDFDADANFAPMTPYVRRLAEKVLEKGLPYGSLLNVNFPLAETYKRIKICKMALGTWKDEFTRHEVYYNKDYYWLGGVNIDDDPNDVLTDNWALNRGYIAITPIKIDETDYSLMDEVSSWDL